jgi:tetratricopeptide (TPR) repeat protein
MRTRSLALAALAALAGLGALGALRPAPAAAQPAVDDRAKAAAHFKQGQAYFKADDFDRAIPEYQAAFDLSAEPSLIFNIALCHSRANRPAQALEAYRRYLELAPDGDIADEARDEVARLTPIVDKMTTDRAAEEARKREAERAAEEARKRETAQQAARERAMAPRSRVPLYIMIGGAAVVAGGATAHVLAWRTRGRLESTSDPDAYFADRDTFELQRTVAIAGYAVGVVTVATGLILRQTVFGREDVQISAAVAPGTAMLTVGWSR